MVERRRFVVKKEAKSTVSGRAETFISQTTLHHDRLLPVYDLLIDFAFVEQDSVFEPLSKAARRINNLSEFLTWGAETESQVGIHLLI